MPAAVITAALAPVAVATSNISVKANLFVLCLLLTSDG